MPLDAQQIEEYTHQLTGLKIKLKSCADEITKLHQLAVSTESSPSQINLFSAKLMRAKETKNTVLEAWDRLTLIHIKLKRQDDFPSADDITWRDEILDTYDRSVAPEISFKAEPPKPSRAGENTTFSNTFDSSIPLFENIKLPHFDGDVMAWARYRNAFKALVDKVDRDPVRKLYLLKDSLSGEARTVVSQFDDTATNYPLAWAALVDTYENKRVLAAAYLERILSFQMKPKPGLTEFQRFLTDVADNVSALRALQLRDAEDKFLALTMLRTMDAETRHRFELKHIGTDFPTVDTIVKFVRNECQALKFSDSRQSHKKALPVSNSESRSSTRFTNLPRRSSPRFYTRALLTSGAPRGSQSPKQSSTPGSTPKRKGEASVRQNPTCPFCEEKHILSRCPVFVGMSSEERFNFASQWKGCTNCLNPAHKLQDCKSRWTCRICQLRHHSLLHLQKPTEPQDTSENEVCTQTLCQPTDNALTGSQVHPECLVILGTAKVSIKDITGRNHSVRLLLDCGSQRSFVTQKCAEELQLKVQSRQTQICGLGGTQVAETCGTTRFTLLNLRGTNRLQMTAAVLPTITTPLPQQPIPRSTVIHFKGYQLADPSFDQPQDIDILVGADFYDQTITGHFRKIQPHLPSLLPTIFGEVIMGAVRTETSTSLVSLLCQPTQEISTQLEAFWKLEEPPSAPRQSPEDIYCEEHYVATHTRTPDGRYMVRLPFASDPHKLGDNRPIAKKRFTAIEAKFACNPDFYEAYKQFMDEYEKLGHLSLATRPSMYVIPHFGILQKKLRVVFDASCASDLTSLNKILLAGPPLQTDICEVLTQFRLYPIAVTTDIVKMYRQILVHPDDRKFQHIYWREAPDHDLQEQELNTVTYGLTSSPFHALRTVKQLILDEGKRFPLAVRRLRRKIFVDDVTTGADNELEAQELCRQLIQLFLCGGFQLSKWSSSVPSVLPVECQQTKEPLTPHPENTPDIKVLGLIWNPQEDTFAYAIHHMPINQFTKRIVLSFISRTFDPLGFLSPVIFTAKTFLQELWRIKADWDDRLPTHLHDRWERFTRHWQDLSQIHIPRYTWSRHCPCTLIGFCDASAKGYAAVLYLRAQYSENEAKISLIMAKTKVAPAKFTSIARLELCGAFMLAKLAAAIDLQEVDVRQKIMFTDSSVVLGWLRTPTHLLHVFEANRVSAINDITPDAVWHHVRTSDNPADIASRGLIPSEMKDSLLWWQGPEWMRLPPSEWPESLPHLSEPLPTRTLATTTRERTDTSWMLRFSRLNTLLRTVTYMLRYSKRSSVEVVRYNQPMTPKELSHATVVCARVVQKSSFPKGILTNELKSLSPFLDELGVLRVGGRLINAPIPASAKHPILIPKDSHLARLIVLDIHHTYFHSGPTLTLSILRNRFWIPAALRLIKGVLSKCVTCFRLRPITRKTIMAPLPSSRLTPGRPFLHTGVDYAGPFMIRDSLRRKPVLSKAFICLFVCLSTKALHLEAVSALTAEAFLAGLDRFIARRGKPMVMHSDNATNLVGADRYMREVTKFLLVQHDPIFSHLANAGIEWRFIPPRSPHFGGMWEAGVKSVKTLLKARIAQQPFTFEEFCTVLIRVEGILNSRPICPLSDDPTSLEPLTQGHFLIGAPLCSPPEEELEEVPTNRLSRWQLVQQSVQSIWSRWRLEYLNTLQQRSKWRCKSPNLQVGDLVILLERSSPTGQWPTARVTATHPGADGTVRVVTVKTGSGAVLRRATNRVALLPVSDP